MTTIHALARKRHLPAARPLPTLRAMVDDIPRSSPPAAALRTIQLTVNRGSIRETVPADATLAELLRDRLGLTGTKVACNQAACGACTVLLDGEAVFACHTLAAHAEGACVETIEGAAAAGGGLSPLQQAFVDRDALQCGYCTPGMIMAIEALLRSRPAGHPPARDEIARAISGNLCRCGAYLHVLDAACDVVAAAR